MQTNVAGLHSKLWPWYDCEEHSTQRNCGQVNTIFTKVKSWSCAPQDRGLWHQTTARYIHCTVFDVCSLVIFSNKMTLRIKAIIEGHQLPHCSQSRQLFYSTHGKHCFLSWSFWILIIDRAYHMTALVDASWACQLKSSKCRLVHRNWWTLRMTNISPMT